MIKKAVLVGVLIFMVGIYFYPSTKYSFSEIYQREDDVSLSLQKFRARPTKTADVNGMTITYQKEGTGDTCILFLHGMGGSYDTWWQQMDHFKQKYTTLSLTYPRVNNLKDLSKCVLSILDRENVRKVVIVGSSLGGYLAQYITTFHPDRVLMVSLGNTFPPNTENKEKNETLMQIMTYMPEWFVIHSIRKKYNAEVVPAAENSMVVNAFLNELLGSLVKKGDFLSRYYCVVDTFISNIHKTIPIQIIESDNDPLVSKTLRDQLKATYPQAKVITLINKGHFPYLNDADHYNTLIDTFLSSDER